MENIKEVSLIIPQSKKRMLGTRHPKASFPSIVEQDAQRMWSQHTTSSRVWTALRCTISSMIRLRSILRNGNVLLLVHLVLVTLYLVLHYVCLRCNVWNHEAFNSPPPSVKLSHKYSGFSGDTLNKFVNLVHPHVHGHPHLNVSLHTAMRRSLGLALFQWVILIRLKVMLNWKLRARLLGLLATLSTFICVTGTIFGGLEVKCVLFPDLWEYIDFRLQVNQMHPEKTTEQVLSVFGNSLPSVSSHHPLHLLNPMLYLGLGSNSSFIPSTEYIERLPFFIFPILYLLHVLDLVGLLLNIVTIYVLAKPFDFTFPGLLLLISLGITSALVSRIPKPNAHDHHWINFNSPYVSRNFKRPDPSTPPIRITKYINMSDGVRLAADIYLSYKTVRDVVCLINNERDALLGRFYKSVFNLMDCPGHYSPSPKTLQLPTYLMVTRYNRRTTVNWPFTLLSFWGQPRGESTTNLWSWQFVDSLVSNDYALIIADTRGTGASFGSRPVDLSPLEIFDLAKIREWITQQFWYNGRVAAGGFSYDGMTGVYLAAIQPIQAVLALFTPINVVHDLIQPGGIVCSSFVEDYTGLTHGFETKGTPRLHLLNDLNYDISLVAGFALVFGHAAPVKSYESHLDEALHQHRLNWNMSEMVQSIHFTDDFIVVPSSKHATEDKCEATHPFLSSRISAKQFGITQHLVHHIASRPVGSKTSSGHDKTAAVYIVGGYCDSSSVRGSLRLYEALRTSKNGIPPMSNQYRLILGPWTHTGRRNCSPFSAGTYSHFEHDMYWDILRFLDYHLKEKEWNLTVEHIGSLRPEEEVFRYPAVNHSKPVHFWSMGDEQWFGEDEYPPRNVTEIHYAFSKPIVHSGPATHVSFDDARVCHQCTSSSECPSFHQNSHIARSSEPSYPSPKKEPNWGLVLHPPQYSRQFHEDFQYIQGPPTDSSHIHYSVDYNATTMGRSRWVIAKHAFRMASYSYREMHPSSLSASFPLLKHLTTYSKWYCTMIASWIYHLEPTLPFNGHFTNLWRILSNSKQLINTMGHNIKTKWEDATLVSFLHSIDNGILWLTTGRKSNGDLLTLTSPLLKKSVRIIGSPLVRFSINLTDEFSRRVYELRHNFTDHNVRIKVNELDPVPALDVTVFAYIEDVDPSTNQVHYVTEGRILLSHRPTIPSEATQNIEGLRNWDGCASRPLSEEFVQDTLTIRQQPRLGSADLVFQNGDRGSHRFTVGGTECIAFTFEPVTWRFLKGHHIRLSLAGADRGNFQWSRTQSKEDVDLLAQSLLFAVKAGNHEWFNEIQRRPVQVERPLKWKIPLNDSQHIAFLKLVFYRCTDDNITSSTTCYAHEHPF